jgi:hypothetical protein
VNSRAAKTSQADARVRRVLHRTLVAADEPVVLGIVESINDVGFEA